MLNWLKKMFKRQSLGVPRDWVPSNENELKEGEYDYAFGALKDPKDNRDFLLSSIQAVPVGAEELPEEFKLKQKFKCKNQFSRGSCTAQSQTHSKQEVEGVELSARFCFALGKEIEGNNSYGAYCRTMEKVNKETGICEERLDNEPDRTMSYDEYLNVNHITEEMRKNAQKYKTQSFWRVGTDIQSLKSAIYKNKISVRASMPWYSEWNRLTDGIMRLGTYDNYVGGHRIVFTGWTKEGLILKNSWGSGWGNDGYAILPYDQLKEKGGIVILQDAYVSLDVPEDLAVDHYYGQKRTWDTFIIEKSVAFNPWLIKKIGRLPNNREIKGLAYGKWSYEAVYLAKHSDLWLKMTKPEAKRLNKI
jgi:C1A family cysteine protease